jgi:hypothetical protein
MDQRIEKHFQNNNKEDKITEMIELKVLSFKSLKKVIFLIYFLLNLNNFGIKRE